MGRGNVCVNGEYEGLFYVDNDYFSMFYNEDGDAVDVTEMEEGSYQRDDYELEWCDFLFDDFKDDLIFSLKRKFKFEECHKYLSQSQDDVSTVYNYDHLAILENKLFFVCLVDNEWSTGVELIQKYNMYHDLSNLQKKHYKKYLKGIAEVLLDIVGEISLRSGPWTSSSIRSVDETNF